ncbi:pentatricopeptide repeat [Trichoderma cornu-damae]|uniref:Pentatricopeptide repeat n=1 Tax=Trichoderma cornu-damae TaxID=654480 RepID=A0A9P8TTK7_9HYPO|nr:pentatricopeptide repeat [Trichoderma cornu-damae]
MPIYSSLYSNFIRQGSTFAKSVTAHGYAQSVVAATHPHVLNSQNRPVFGRRQSNRPSRVSAFPLYSAFHNEKLSSGLTADHHHVSNHGGLDAYFEALQKKQAAGEEEDKEWAQFDFPKRIEWKPNASSVLAGESVVEAGEDASTAIAELSAEADADADADASAASDAVEPQHLISAEEEAALAHIDAALEKELQARQLQAVAEKAAAGAISTSAPHSRARTPAPVPAVEASQSAGRVDPPPSVQVQSQSYADHLQELSEAARYAEIPAVFEAMLATGVRPIAGAYNALLLAAIHIPSRRTEVVSKALDVYADMMRRRVSPDGQTFNILVGLLSSRSLEVSEMKSLLEDKRLRFGGMDEPGKFMFASHELERAILCEDERLDLAVKLFDMSFDAGKASYSSETYRQLISACAQLGRVSDMLRFYEHMELSDIVPSADVFPTMITAYAKSGNLVSAVECYNEYRSLAISQDAGSSTLGGRLDAQVYASVINAYVISDKVEGAMRFFKKVVDEYGISVAEMKDALVNLGFVRGFVARGVFREALQWARSLDAGIRDQVMMEIAAVAADGNDAATAVEAYANIHAASLQDLASPSIALLAMSVRLGDVASASRYWHVLSDPEMHATAAFIEPTAMYAVSLIGSGQVAEGLARSEMMFQRIRAAGSDARLQLGEEVDEGADFIARYMQSRGIVDPRELASQMSTIPSQAQSISPFLSTPTVSSHEDSHDPYAHSTDFKGSSLIADDLEGIHGRKGPRLGEALNRFRNMRRAGRHPRYITYAKLISAAAREGKMDLCRDIVAMARSDVPPVAHNAVVRYGWSSILDAMVGACLTLGDRGQAERHHQELLEMGATPSANTFGLYITTLKESTKTFDEASEAVRIFLRAKAEGVEPSSFLYNALIGKLGKARRIDDCLFYFAEMRALGIKPTSVTYGTIVNALCRVSDDKFAEELFDEMESMPNYKARPAPYNSMMQFFLTTKRDKSKVLAYYDRMASKGIAPTSHTYKLLIDTHATLETVDMEAAEQVLEEMRAAGQRPESVHYASLIHARGCVLHDMAGARKVFDSVVEECLVPVNANIYQALFEAMVANHRVAETESVLAEMRSRQVELTPYIANTLIHGWAAERKIEKAQAVYDAVAREKREPSTYEAMTRAFLAVEQRDEAKAVVGEMLTRGYPTAVVNKAIELLGGSQEASLE